MESRAQINKYLARYAEPEAARISVDRHYDHVLVIPAYAESAQQLRKVWQATSGDFLVIIVVNCPDSGPDRQTENLADELKRHSGHGQDILIVDRYSEGKRIPVRQGVGLARKIGCDIALSLINLGYIRDTWIFTTDADAILPENYFTLSQKLKASNSALIFPFHHTASPELTEASRTYELSMLYYAAGLTWAGSDYAYTTIGSTVTFSANYYAMVRGFPKRNTGEDFYLLNKLRKAAPISCLSKPAISIEGRISERVPVGTGRAIARLSISRDIARVEHPQCYQYLRATLTWMNQISISQPASPQTDMPLANELLEGFGFFKHYERKRQQSPTPEVMRKHLHDWFDALKTRQFIHGLRDRQSGYVPITAVGEAQFLPETTSIERLLAACRKQVFRA